MGVVSGRRGTSALSCPICGRRRLRNAVAVAELRVLPGSATPRLVRTVILGCNRCLTRLLWEGAFELFQGYRGLLALLVLPFGLFHALRALVWSLALPLIGPTAWLRQALTDAG